MKKIKKLVLMLAAAGVIGLFAGCDTSSSSGGGGPETPEQPATGGKIAKKAIVINGVTFDKTAEVYATETAVTITGSNDYSEIFIEGRNVTLSPFIMGKYEVTQELYKAVMKDQKVTVDGTEYTLAAEPSYCSDASTTYVITEGETQKYRPVEGVTWYDAVYFCNVLSEKLNLTEAYVIEVTTVNSEGQTVIDYQLKQNGNLQPAEETAQKQTGITCSAEPLVQKVLDIVLQKIPVQTAQAGTGITLQMEQHQMQPQQVELPVTEHTKLEKKLQMHLACMT